MLTLYMDLRADMEVVVDHEGISVTTLDEAMSKAVLNARSIMAADVREGFLNFAQEIVIRDASGEVFHRLPFANSVIVQGLPSSPDGTC